MQPTEHDIAQFLAEDIGAGDITAQLIANDTVATATVICREAAVLCGVDWFNAVFKQLAADCAIQWFYQDGDWLTENAVLCQLKGPARALLTGERTALNLVQTLSATATKARHYADAVVGTGCRILDTRKTLPGLRLAQKYAVRCGGCDNHRMGLYDALLIKENHIAAAGSIANAVAKAKAQSNLPIEVEVENLTEFKLALTAKPHRIMLDNFTLADLKAAVAMNQNQIELEASGNITLDTIRSIAETGVDFISIGALTKNIQAIDLSMRIELEIK